MSNVSSTVANPKKGYGRKKTIHILITLSLFFLFGFLPAPDPITPLGMKVLGVFLGAIYGYTFCESIWVSFVGIIAFGITGYASMATTITNAMGNSTVFTSLTGALSAGALSYYGFGKWFVRWSLGLPIFKGKPIRYTLTFFLLFGFAAFIINQLQLSILLFSIWKDIADNCGYDKDSPFRYVGYGGILLSTIMGSSLITYRGWSLGLAKNWRELTGGYLNLGAMIVMTSLCLIGTMVIYVYFTKWLYKIDYSIMKGFDSEKLGDEGRVLTPRVKRIAIVYTSAVILVIIASMLSNRPIGAFLSTTFTDAGLFALALGILLLLPSGEGDGKPCIVFKEVKNTSVPWDSLMLCALIIPLSSAVTNEVTGVSPFVANILGPIFGNSSTIVLLSTTIIVSALLTNLGSNVAFGALLIPLIAPFAVQEGVNASIIGMALLWIVKLGVALPGASAPAAIYHGQPELSNSKLRIGVMVWGSVILCVVSLVVFIIGSFFVH